MTWMDRMAKRVRGKELVHFHCRRCGRCCRNLREQAMVENLDAYRIAKYLKEHGPPEIDMATVFDEYTVPVLLPGNFPIFMVKTAGQDEACIFLNGDACSIYPARLRVCRLYPFSVDTGEHGQDFIWYQCLERQFHFTGGTVRVKDWFNQNFSREDRAFVLRERDFLPQLGKRILAMEGDVLDAAIREICLLRYAFFDLDEPFLPQYDRNATELLRRLDRLAQENGIEV